MRKPIMELSDELGIPYAELRQSVNAITNTLKATRENRELPRLDDKVIAGWNGMMIGAYAMAGSTLEDPAYTQAARNAASFVLKHMRDESGNLLRLRRKGVSEQPAFHEDYAFLIRGLTTLYRTTQDQQWLDAAVDLADRAHKLFWDQQEGGYFFTTESPDLIAMSKSARDSAIPSGNSAMAHALIDLWELTGADRWRSRARDLLETFSGIAAGSPTGHIHMVHAIERYNELPDQHDTQTRETSGEQSIPMLKLPSSFRNSTIGAASTNSSAHAKVSAQSHPQPLRVGEQFTVRINIDIAAGWHINANKVTSPDLIPTRVDIRSDLPVSVLDIDYPDAIKLDAAYSESPIEVFQGSIEITATCVLDEPASDETAPTLRVATVFQACDDQSCLAPHTDIQSIPLKVDH